MTLLTLILAQSLFYPSVTDLYRQGKALTTETCVVPASAVYASDEALISRKKIYEKMPSASLRSDMAGWFSRSRNAKSAPLLLELLSREKNPFVRLDLVRALQNLKDQGISYVLPESFSAYILQKEAPVDFKAAAMTLYSSFYPEKAVKVLFKAVREDPEPYLLNAACTFLKDHAKLLPRQELIALYRKGSSLRKGGDLHCFAASLLSRQKLSPEWNKLLLRDLKSASLLLSVRIAAGTAQNPSADPELIRSCSLDGREAVRLTLAKESAALNGVKLEALLQLCNDRSAFVREEVFRAFGRNVRSLSRAEREKALMALLEGVKDPVKSVRQASVRSLEAFSLSGEEESLLLSQVQSFAPAWEQIIFYARQKQVKSYAPAVAEQLDFFRKDLFLLREALLFLGEVRYTPATGKVMALASFKAPSIRQASAFALGRFRQRNSYPVLKKLLRDKDQNTAFEAAKGIFSIGGNVFVPDHLRVLRTRTSAGADLRAIAVRSLDKVPLVPGAWRDLETLLLKACIVEPMSPPMPEVPSVRVSILMLLHNKAARKDPKAAALLAKAMKELSRSGKNEDMADEVFEEYFRQFKVFREGGKVIPGRIRNTEPVGAVKTLK